MAKRAPDNTLGEAAGFAAASAITLYGFLIVCASAIAEKEWFPEKTWQVGVVLAVVFVLGGVLGAAAHKARYR